MSKDTFIFNRLSTFQKANTFVFFDKRHPDKTLGYMLFIPPVKNVNPRTKIWSWSLGFKFGKFYFTSLIVRRVMSICSMIKIEEETVIWLHTFQKSSRNLRRIT